MRARVRIRVGSRGLVMTRARVRGRSMVVVRARVRVRGDVFQQADPQCINTQRMHTNHVISGL